MVSNGIVELPLIDFGPKNQFVEYKIAIFIQDIYKIEYAIDAAIPKDYIGQISVIHLKDGTHYFVAMPYVNLVSFWKEELHTLKMLGGDYD